MGPNGSRIDTTGVVARPSHRAKGALLLASGAALVAGGVPLLTSGTASADDILTVTTLADSGAGSLREAIGLANADADHDTIVFSVAGTINLASDLDAIISYSTSIVGAGITIDGGGNYSALRFQDMATDSEIDVAGITITNTSGSNGSALRADAVAFSAPMASITLTDITVTNATSSGNGGALYLYGAGSIAISGATITGNTSTGSSGGGAYIGNSDTITITDSTISDNQAQSGGGLFVNGFDGLYGSKDTTILRTTLSGNTSSGCGGGAFFNGGANQAIAAVHVVESTIDGNDSACGGGLHFQNGNIGSAFEVLGSTVSNNISSAYGGGLYIRQNWTAGIANSTISGNSALYDAGAIFASEGLYLIASTVTDNTTLGTTGGIQFAGAFAVPVEFNPADSGTSALGQITASIVAGNDGYDLGLYSGTPKVIAVQSLIGSVDLALDFEASSGTEVDIDVAQLQLGALADNGGPTFTHALGTGSIAIDASGSGADLPSFTGNAYDQRGVGFARISNGMLDTGAFEVQVAAPDPDPIVPNFTG